MVKSDQERRNKYRFLHDHIAKEAYIFDILDVIWEYQQSVLTEGKGELATLETLKKSRGIKMPFSPTRNKNISYLVDVLVKNYPDDVKSVISFDFEADPSSKKLEIRETRELTVLMKIETFNRIQEQRDSVSVQNLNRLLSQFRLFNLTKLLKKAQFKKHLAYITKIELGKTIFTFKNYRLDRNSLEHSEDYAFHRDNYESVQKSLDMDQMQEIISANSAQVLRRLKNFGILNTNFADYRDSKLDYLLNILLDDLGSAMGDKDLIAVKNFHSLRTCLLKVDKLIDPLLTVSNELAKHIRENSIVRESDLLVMFDNISRETLRTWDETCFDKYKILAAKDDHGQIKYIDGRILLPRITDLSQLILYKPDTFYDLDHNERHNKISSMDLLCAAGRDVLASDDKAHALLGTDEKINALGTIIQEYGDHQKRQAMRSSLEQEQAEQRRRKGFLEIVGDFFKSLFGKPKYEPHAASSGHTTIRARRVGFSRDTRDLYSKVKSRQSKIIPLSDYIELTPENELKIDTIIKEVRGNNLKIVIPIYNAPKVLYPNRSQKYLIPNVEYLMVNPDIIQSAEAVRAFTDTLVGEKLKDEVIPGPGILAVEKYLLTLFRQKRAVNLKKARAQK